MFTVILMLFGLADIATCIYLYLYCVKLISDICKINAELNQIRKEMGDTK